jgi:D-inositol-3-phosphate glycosyltransferase
VHIAMVSEHASPLAAPGSPDAGGQNVHVSELSRALAAAGHEVTVLTRRDDPDLPELVPLHPGVTVRHVDAGPARSIPKDELVPHLPALADGLERAWRAEPPDVVHAHFWMSGLAATAALGDQDIPFVQTFHALGSVKRRHQRGADTSPPGRIGAEQALARRADRVLATCDDELFELIRMGADRHRVSVVPCGVDARAFSPDGPTVERSARPRVVSLGRLVRRKGVDEVVAAMARADPAKGIPTSRACGNWPSGATSRTGCGSSARSPARRCPRCCVLRTLSCARPGTSRSASSRSRRWRAGAPSSPPPSAACRTPSCTV